VNPGAPPYRFVTARTLAAVRDLELAARIVVDGVMLGRHGSHRAGAGLEFSQYRSYQPGDDPRRIDWKLLARSDRYFVREAETETSITVRLLLDATGSMAHQEDGLTKLDYARYLVAALALLAQRQGDAFGLYVLARGGVESIPPARGQRHLHRVLHRLEALEPVGDWPPWLALERSLLPDTPRGVTILVGDLHEREDEIRTALRRLGGARHDVVCLRILGRQELEFGYRGTVTLEDLETGRRVDLDAGMVGAMARDRLALQLSAQRRDLEDRGAAVVTACLDQPFEVPLREYLARRDRFG
jgi:uncharacterized protein (DUF58 family)